MTGRVSASGNINSLLTGKGISNYSMSEHPSYAFYSLFSGCSSLISPPTVSAERVKEYSYYGMFEYCTSLESTPELPAEDISSDCYNRMFQYCTSLKSCMLELSATVMKSYCYYFMFCNCLSLEVAPKLPAATLAPSCYANMFNGCASLLSMPELPATTLTTSCYDYMFYNCTSLNSAVPIILPAGNIVARSYYLMFNGVKDIKEIYCYAKSIQSDGCSSWLTINSTDKVFYGYASTNWPRSSSGVPSQWKFVALPEYEVKFVGQWKPVSFVDEPDKATVGDGWVAFKSYSNFNVHSSHSDMLIEVDVPTDTAIFHFKAMVYGELDCDYLVSYIDDIQYDIYETQAWTDIYITVSQGKHVLKFSYIKDGSVSNNPDCAYLALPVAELDVELSQDPDPEPTPQYAYSRSSAYQTSNNQLQNATITGIYEQDQNGYMRGDTHKDYEITGMWLNNGSALTFDKIGLSCYMYSSNPCIRIYNQTGGIVSWNKLECIGHKVFRLYLAQDHSDLSLDTGSQKNYCYNRNGISVIYRTTNETYTLVGAYNSSGESVDYSQLTVGYTSSLHNMYVANNGGKVTLSYVEFTVSGGDGVA